MTPEGKQNDVVAGSMPVRHGSIDRIDKGVAIGWAYDPVHPARSLTIEIRANGLVCGTGLASQYSSRLLAAGIGEGYHQFAIPLQAAESGGRQVELTLHDVEKQSAVPMHRCIVSCLDPIAVGSDDLGPRHFIGLPTPRTGKRARRARALGARIARPWNRLGKRFASSAPTLSEGVLAMLASLERSCNTSAERLSVWPQLVLPVCDDPEVTIILPVHNQFRLTFECLRSLVLAEEATSFEVLLVDDCSTDATTVIERQVENLRVLRNSSNQGFLHNCNHAAAQARGRYLLFLNNDTVVMPRWLDALVAAFSSADYVGAAGSKLVYPDGRLQDAGGIVWASGTPCNVGHGANPDDPQYNYARDVDYLTGAALMVERGAWSSVGGFTDTYAPAYYEDTDLAFKLRAAGYRTVYCPQSEVVHYEGGSHGKSVDSGVKQHQVINAITFVDRWKPAFHNLGVEGLDLAIQKDRGISMRVLMIDNAFPRLGVDAGSYAALQEIRLMQALGAKVTFMPHNLQHLGRHVDALQIMGVECVHAPYHRSVSRFLERRGSEFDAVYVTRYNVAEKVLPLVRQFCRAPVIFNNADLHFLRELRGALNRGQADLAGPMRTRQRELAVMASVDAILSYNDTEHQIITSHLLRNDHLFKCPWVLEDKRLPVPLRQRQGIAFLGGFGHPPNREAMDWFITHVMPCLRAARPDLVLNVWGSQVPDDAGWQDVPGVQCRGFAESLDEVFAECRVFVAPLLSGAGIKGKVLDSVAYGVPSVLSPIAAEATGLIDGVSTHVAVSVDDWVAHIGLLLDDDTRWCKTADALARICREQYSFDGGLVRMRHIFETLGVIDREQLARAA